ncbi:MAG: hypothetical protein KBH85_01395 [Lachnospiraceae bacterium]|nr:hypothetical protein [Lachnospiraceae bacterium]
MGNTVKFDKRKSDDLKELKRRQAEFDKVSYEYNQHLNRFCLIGENSKGGTSYEKAVDDVIECMGALSIAGHAVKEQREKMGLRTKPKSHDGSTEGGAEDSVDDMEDGQDGFLWRDHIEDDDGEPDK